MTKEEFYQLIKEWSRDTSPLSYHDTSHPAYVKAVQGGEEVIPWALERLKDSVGHDSGNAMDHDNSPWFAICLLTKLTNHECMSNFSNKYAGMLSKIRNHILKWGKTQGHIKF